MRHKEYPKGSREDRNRFIQEVRLREGDELRLDEKPGRGCAGKRAGSSLTLTQR
jgi:hypothetical protein